MINMRKYMKKAADFSNGAVLSKITLSARGATKDTTIRDLMKMYRSDFNRSLRDGEHFGYLKHYEDKPDMNNCINGIFSILTNVGQFKLDGPFDDVAISTNTIAKPSNVFPAASFLHYGIIGKGRNEVITKISYEPSVMTRREADLFVNSIRYGLENIDLDKTIAEAMDMIKDYQNNYIKTQYPKYIV